MADKKTQEKTKEIKHIENKRVYVDASSPSARAIIKIVLIVLLILFLAFVIGATFYLLSFLLFLLVLAVFFAYLLDPLVKFIRKPFKVRNREKLMPRPLAIVISYLIVFSVLGLAIAYLAPLIIAQIGEFVENLPNYARLVQDRIFALNSRYEQLSISTELQTQINGYISSFFQYATVTLTALLVFLVGFATYLPWLLLVPIFSFFLLKDAHLFRMTFLNFFPSGSWRSRADSLLMDVNKTLAAYTRAQLISCILIGSLCTLGFTLVGLDYAILLGILAGILEFIPLLGPLTIGITATLVGAFSNNPWQALWVAIFLLTLRFTHDYVTYPRIVRDGVHLHPFTVILSVLAGEQIAGIPGVFLSIPIVAILTVLYKNIVEHSERGGILQSFFGSLDKPEKVSKEIIEEESKEEET